MSHKAKRLRLFNEERLAIAASKQEPLPMDGPDGQLARAAERAKAHHKRYPVPPVYRMSYRYPTPTQPLCYTFPVLSGSRKP